MCIIFVLKNIVYIVNGQFCHCQLSKMGEMFYCIYDLLWSKWSLSHTTCKIHTIGIKMSIGEYLINEIVSWQYGTQQKL